MADPWGLRLDGAPLCRWKDRINTAFMDRFAPPPKKKDEKLAEAV